MFRNLCNSYFVQKRSLSSVIDGIVEIKSCKIHYVKSIGRAGNGATLWEIVQQQLLLM